MTSGTTAVVDPEAQLPQASWIAIGSLAMGAFALVTSEFLPVGLLPAIAREMGSTSGETGLMVTLPGLAAAVAAPLTMHYGRQLERKRLLLCLLGLLAASNLIVAFSPVFAMILFVRALLAIAIGGFWTIAGALGARLRSGPQDVRANAVILGGASLGTVAGLPAGSLLSELIGWRYAFGAGAILAALAMAALMALLPRLPAQPSSGLSDVPVLMRQRPAMMSVLAASIMYTGTYGAYTYIAPFLNEHSGVSGAVLSAVFLANGLAGFLGNMVGGWLSGRSPYRSVLTTVSIAIGAIVLLSVLGSSPILAIGLVALWGFSLGMQAISMLSWLQANASGRPDAMQALYVSVSQAALGLGALAGGIAVDHAGTTGALAFGAAASVFTLLLAIMQHRSRHSEAGHTVLRGVP